MQTKELLKLGAAYSKKYLGEIFQDEGLKTLREGIYTVKKYHSTFLFVDLIKKDKEERFQFDDYFDEDHFQWDSQTTQHINSPRIQAIVNKEVEVHLFCRMHEYMKGITQPFYYCGELEYLDFDEHTSKPVHIQFLSLDFNANTSSRNLLELYEWKPEKVETTGTQDKLRKKQPRRGYKNPNFTERKGLVTSRVGQGFYRQRVLEKWNYKCPVTGCDIPSILIASHIKGWGESNDEERLDENNGILLSPNADALFDKHLITFNNNGSILISKTITQSNLFALGISEFLNLSVDNNTIKYLEHHRDKFLMLESLR